MLKHLCDADACCRFLAMLGLEKACSFTTSPSSEKNNLAYAQNYSSLCSWKIAENKVVLTFGWENAVHCSGIAYLVLDRDASIIPILSSQCLQTSLGTFALKVAFCVALIWPSVISPSGLSQGFPMTTSFKSAALRESERSLVSFRHFQQQTVTAMLELALTMAAANSKTQNKGSCAASRHQLAGITGQLLLSKFSLAAKKDSAPCSAATLSFKGAASTLPHASKA
mmetsp:Transcript_28493/g.45998  ORF Transcript_28493/g.45998 Transcript_28493/m.45998 type:complete len:226 (-) Transcript_28493:479-1156(-)